MLPMPLPESGIPVPAVPDVFLPRPRLADALDSSDSSAVTLVCAPSGYGKSTLLRTWAMSAAPGGGAAWLDVEPAHNDPRRLRSAMLAALRAPSARSGNGDPVEIGTRAEQVGPSLADVVETLDTLPVRVPLVLHDLQAVTARAALEDLEALVAARPAGTRLILCSSHDPPIALGALRSRGAIQEIRADQLRFTARETGDLLERLGLRLSLTHIRHVFACTGGWPAGVRLTGAALLAHADAGAFFARFAADPRPTADLLVAEVLKTLPTPTRAVLSTVADGTADSADARVGAALEQIARTGLVTREPAGRYRVNPLVAAHLRHTARPAPVPLSQQRLGNGGDGVIARLDRAARAGVIGPLAELVRASTGHLLVHGHHDALGRALEQIGAAAADDVWLTLCSALVHVEFGHSAAAAEDLRRARALWPAEPGHRLTVLRSVAELFAAAADADLTAARAPMCRPPGVGDDPEWAALAMTGIGGGAMMVGADQGGGHATLEEAVGLALRGGYRHLQMQCHAVLAGVAGMTGDYAAMAYAARRAVVTARAGGWERSPWWTAANWMLAYAALLQGEPAEARRLANLALHRGPALPARLTFALRVVHGAALFDTGRRYGGLREMRQARTELGSLSLTAEQAALVAVLEHQAAVGVGQTDAADDVADWLTGRVGTRGESLIMRAWTELAAGRERAARAAVQPVLDRSVPTTLPSTVVEAHLVEATADAVDGDLDQARHAMQRALSLGARLNTVRSFTMVGPQARELLGSHVSHSTMPEPFAVRALAAGSTVDRVRASSLEEAERRILAWLPSPHPLSVIADELGVAYDEARGRLHAVYRRLGVSSRRTAVIVAHERGLLP